MSATELRKAAELLRERAKAATTGPWMDEVEEHQDHGGADRYWHVTDDQRVNYVGNVDTGPDATYIATMHPGVGDALASLLSMMADHAVGRGSVCGSCVEYSETIARLINGGAA